MRSPNDNDNNDERQDHEQHHNDEAGCEVSRRQKTPDELRAEAEALIAKADAAEKAARAKEAAAVRTSLENTGVLIGKGVKITTVDEAKALRKALDNGEFREWLAKQIREEVGTECTSGDDEGGSKEPAEVVAFVPSGEQLDQQPAGADGYQHGYEMSA